MKIAEHIRTDDQFDESQERSPFSEPQTTNLEPAEPEPSPGLVRRFWNLLSGGTGDSNYGDNYYN